MTEIQGGEGERENVRRKGILYVNVFKKTISAPSIIGLSRRENVALLYQTFSVPGVMRDKEYDLTRNAGVAYHVLQCQSQR